MVGRPDGIDVSGEFEGVGEKVPAAVVGTQGSKARMAALGPRIGEILLAWKAQHVEDRDVPWDGDSFGPPPYWGARGTYWLNSAPSWGLMVDYNHAKVIADQGAVVSVTGTRDGVKLGPKDRVGDTFQVMEFTNGINEIFFGGQYRWMFDRWTPYVGVGVGFAFPHVEVRRAGPNQPYTYDYEVTGVAVEGLVGLEYHLTQRFSLFGDYKLSYSNNDASLKDGGSLQTDVVTNHFIFGASYRFGGGPAPEAYDPYK